MRLKPVVAALLSVVLGVGAALIPWQAEALDVYTTPGTHNINGRQWKTACEAYSTTIERCRTEIWASTISYSGGRYTQRNGWAFNNLTYKPRPRTDWTGNILAIAGDHTKDGRRWRTECDTSWTGTNACRSSIWATVYESTGSGFRSRQTWVFNNIVKFSTSASSAPFCQSTAAASAGAGSTGTGSRTADRVRDTSSTTSPEPTAAPDPTASTDVAAEPSAAVTPEPSATPGTTDVPSDTASPDPLRDPEPTASPEPSAGSDPAPTATASAGSASTDPLPAPEDGSSDQARPATDPQPADVPSPAGPASPMAAAAVVTQSIASSIDALATVNLTGTLTPATTDATVTAWIDTASGWLQVGAANVLSNGSYSIPFSYGKGSLGTYRVRACATLPSGHKIPAASASTVTRARIANAVVTNTTAAEVTRTYRSGCPVGPSGLSTVRINQQTMDGSVYRGEIIVRRDRAADVVHAFTRSFEAGFPVFQMTNPDAYEGNDVASMAANNTSAFNCRKVVGNPYAMSPHSYGYAVDINPLQNPYRDPQGRWYPSTHYVNRTPVVPGMLTTSSAPVVALKERGWSWFSGWDWHHFEKR